MAISGQHSPDPSSVAHPLGDPLGEILHLLKLTGTFYCQAHLTAPWGFDIPKLEGVLAFLVVTDGRGWLDLSGREPFVVEKGDLVLLTGGAEHRLRSAPDAPTEELSALPVRKITQAYET